MIRKYHYIIIGSGIIGLSIALKLKERNPDTKILIIDKEIEEACHSSGRNSGVLHAGFYYSADSFKARFTAKGNLAMKEYCRQKNLPINACGKLVVAQDEEELHQLYELERRGKANGSNVQIVDENQAKEIEPNIKTFKKALYSPDTATIDPKDVCTAIKKDLEEKEVAFSFNTKFLDHKGNEILTNNGEFDAETVINCAGLYADKIAQNYDFGKQYTMIPFKGLYLKYNKNKSDVRINIYPVPNLKNPFLGVHFTKTVHADIKIGPTAIPAFWRENYTMFSGFNFGELANIINYESRLFFKNSFGFRDLAFEEMRKYRKKYFIGLAQNMVQHIDPSGFQEYTEPGIRSQLLDIKKLELVQDFVIEGDHDSIHILNAVSPAYTCAFVFADYVIDNYLK